MMRQADHHPSKAANWKRPASAFQQLCGRILCSGLEEVSGWVSSTVPNLSKHNTGHWPRCPQANDHRNSLNCLGSMTSFPESLVNQSQALKPLSRQCRSLTKLVETSPSPARRIRSRCCALSSSCWRMARSSRASQLISAKSKTPIVSYPGNVVALGRLLGCGCKLRHRHSSAARAELRDRCKKMGSNQLVMMGSRAMRWPGLPTWPRLPKPSGFEEKPLIDNFQGLLQNLELEDEESSWSSADIWHQVRDIRP